MVCLKDEIDARPFAAELEILLGGDRGYLSVSSSSKTRFLPMHSRPEPETVNTLFWQVPSSKSRKAGSVETPCKAARVWYSYWTAWEVLLVEKHQWG